jgi:hypothetical protein
MIYITCNLINNVIFLKDNILQYQKFTTFRFTIFDIIIDCVKHYKNLILYSSELRSCPIFGERPRCPSVQLFHLRLLIKPQIPLCAFI